MVIAPKRCKVFKCENEDVHGTFFGDFCAPCHFFITQGKGINSQACHNAIELIRRRIYEKLKGAEIANRTVRLGLEESLNILEPKT